MKILLIRNFKYSALKVAEALFFKLMESSTVSKPEKTTFGK